MVRQNWPIRDFFERKGMTEWYGTPCKWTLTCAPSDSPSCSTKPRHADSFLGQITELWFARKKVIEYPLRQKKIMFYADSCIAGPGEPQLKSFFSPGPLIFFIDCTFQKNTTSNQWHFMFGNFTTWIGHATNTEALGNGILKFTIYVQLNTAPALSGTWKGGVELGYIQILLAS